jgi:ASPIC and UnbV/FG-GAP repeat
MVEHPLVVGEEELAAAFEHHAQALLPHQRLEPRDRRGGRHQVVALRSEPQSRKAGIVEKDIRRARRVRTSEDASAEAGLNVSTPKAHRGAAIADFNNDGKPDVVVSALNEPAELWENTTTNGGNWLVIRLQGVKSNRDGIGASIRVDKQYNHMTTSFGYASSTLAGVHFGLGAKTVAEEIEIRWPSGTVQKLAGVKANQALTVRER